MNYITVYKEAGIEVAMRNYYIAVANNQNDAIALLELIKAIITGMKISYDKGRVEEWIENRD